MHCSLLYQILGNPATNIQCGLTLNQWRDSRKIVLTLILGTDMVHHFEQISKAQVWPLLCEIVFFLSFLFLFELTLTL
jgi:hypothetical protein